MMFCLYADYRPGSKGNPYYVEAPSKGEAIRKFKKMMSWLDVRGTEAVTEDKAKAVRADPLHHILF